MSRFLPQIDIRRERSHHGVELRNIQRLRAIADRFFGRRMHFHNQAVGSNGNARARQRRNQAALSSGVARIQNHRQMRQLIERRHGRDVAGVARHGFKGADTALAQNHVRISVRHHILGRHQQFLDGGTHAALQQHRAAALAQAS